MAAVRNLLLGFVLTLIINEPLELGPLDFVWRQTIRKEARKKETDREAKEK
jgi:hypothetical protein